MLRETSSRRHGAAGFLVGCVIVALLVVGKILVEDSGLGRQFDQFAYNLIQWRMPGPSMSDETPVVVVDITDLPPDYRIIAGRMVPVTSRTNLLSLLDAIVAEQPKGIGIDVDFSPQDGAFIDAMNDPAFFQACLSLRRNSGRPVSLGIFRTRKQEKETWLLKPEFSDLAATIRVPVQNRRMPLWDQAVATQARCPGLGAALVSDAAQRLPKPVRWLSWAMETVAEHDVTPELRTAEFFINYAPMRLLEKERIQAGDAAAIRALRHRIAGRYVLLGYATPGDAKDTFNLAGQIDPVPGVYLHACAICTLLQGRPFYELKAAGRVALDVLFGVLVLGSVTLISRYYSLRESSKGKVQRVITWAAIWLIILVGIALVRVVHLIWLDFLLVCIALLVHAPAEKIAIGISLWLRRGWNGIIRDDAGENAASE